MYAVYGQHLACEWPLNLPKSPPGHSPDITIEFAGAQHFEAGRKLAGVEDSRDWFQHALLQDGTSYLYWSDLFEFLVFPDGNRILGNPLHHSSEEVFKTYLLGQVLSFALLHRGLEPLHATTVVIDGSAVALLGHNGYGKSSLAGAFLAAGYRLLTDDLLVLQQNGFGFNAYPGPPRIKMFPGMARRVLPQRPRGQPMNHATRKMIIPLQDIQLAGTAVPLRAIYVLNPPKASPRVKVSIRGMSHRKALVELLRGTFNSVNTHPARLKRQFAFAHALCGVVPVRTLAYPRKVSMLAQVTGAVLSDLERLN